MLEIIKTHGFLTAEDYSKETWFRLDGNEGYCLRKEGKYYPEIPASIRIDYNGCTIISEGGYYINGGNLPSDKQLKELSDAFDSELYDAMTYDILDKKLSKFMPDGDE